MVCNFSEQLANDISLFDFRELYSNNISGKIPNELGNLTELVSLDLYLNNLIGPIPDSLGKLQKLRFLYELYVLFPFTCFHFLLLFLFFGLVILVLFSFFNVSNLELIFMKFSSVLCLF